MTSADMERGSIMIAKDVGTMGIISFNITPKVIVMAKCLMMKSFMK